jgi:hypothetical protein
MQTNSTSMQTNSTATQTNSTTGAMPLYSAGHIAGVAIGSGLVFLICIPLIMVVVLRSRRHSGYGFEGMGKVIAGLVFAVVACVVTTLAIGLAWGLNAEFCCT